MVCVKQVVGKRRTTLELCAMSRQQSIETEENGEGLDAWEDARKNKMELSDFLKCLKIGKVVIRHFTALLST